MSHQQLGERRFVRYPLFVDRDPHRKLRRMRLALGVAVGVGAVVTLLLLILA